MANLELLKHIISENKNDIAFVIGNGIHNYFRNKDTNYNCMSWSELLKYLWKTFVKKTYPSFLNSKNSNNISNTEFFDLLEIEFISKFQKEVCPSKIFYSQHINHDYCKKIIDIQYPFKTIELLSKRNQGINLTCSHLISEKFKKAHSNLMNIAERELGIKNENSFDHFINIITAINNKTILMDLYEPIKKEISRKMGEYKTITGINKITKFIKGINAPILTTNYDTVLSKSIGINDDEIISLTNNTDNNWSSYFGERLETPLSGFGIWHIHGFHNYYKSISIGASDYMKNIHKALNLLPENISLAHLEKSNWLGSKTWLSIIFNKSIFMFGLGLDVDETFIRWLLIMRYKYMSIRGDLKKAWYVTVSSEKIPCAKRYFLESVGFEIVDIPNWDILYEKVWE